MIRLISIDSDGPFTAIDDNESNSMATTPIKLLMGVFSFVNIFLHTLPFSQLI